MRRLRPGLGLAVLLTAASVLVACSGREAEPDDSLDIPTNELMIHVIDPAAYAFWGGWGFIIDETGERDLSPRTEQEWKTVEDGAATVVVAANALLGPGHQREPQADWIRHAQAVAKVAMQGKEAAERKDAAALEEIGAALDEACEACHERFIPNYTPRPSPFIEGWTGKAPAISGKPGG